MNFNNIYLIRNLLFVIYSAWILNVLNVVDYINFNRQILNLFLIFGIFLTIENKLKQANSKISLKSIFFATLLNLFLVIRATAITNNSDKFAYFILPILLFSYLLFNSQFFKLNSFKNSFFLASLYPIFGFLSTPLAYATIPLTTTITWLFLSSIGFQFSLYNSNQIIFNNKGIFVDLGCSGTGMMIFSLTTSIIYYLINPLRKRKYVWITFIINTIVPYFINIFRLSILAIAILIMDNQTIFNFFHVSYGSFLFNVFSTIVSSEVYKFFLVKDKGSLNV